MASSSFRGSGGGDFLLRFPRDDIAFFGVTGEAEEAAFATVSEGIGDGRRMEGEASSAAIWAASSSCKGFKEDDLLGISVGLCLEGPFPRVRSPVENDPGELSYEKP